MVFGARKNDVVEPSVRMEMPEGDPLLRNEVDPDPLIEEMVGRLRDGLGTLVAIDEWGRPLAWRNVVRLALGPLAGKLRDTEQALELAVSMIPPSPEAQATVAEVRAELQELADAAEARAAAEAELAEAASQVEIQVEPVVEAAPVVSVVEPPVATEYLAQPPAATEYVAEAPAATEYIAEPTVEVILPAAEAAPEAPLNEATLEEVHGHAVLVEEPIVIEEPVAQEPVAEAAPAAPQVAPSVAPVAAVPHVQPTAVPPATSLFTVSGDQRAVPVSPLGTGELLGGGSADDSTTAKYDRFLASLYSQGQQVRRDEDRGSR